MSKNNLSFVFFAILALSNRNIDAKTPDQISDQISKYHQSFRLNKPNKSNTIQNSVATPLVKKTPATETILDGYNRTATEYYRAGCTLLPEYLGQKALALADYAPVIMPALALATSVAVCAAYNHMSTDSTNHHDQSGECLPPEASIGPVINGVKPGADSPHVDRQAQELNIEWKSKYSSLEKYASTAITTISVVGFLGGFVCWNKARGKQEEEEVAPVAAAADEAAQEKPEADGQAPEVKSAWNERLNTLLNKCRGKEQDREKNSNNTQISENNVTEEELLVIDNDKNKDGVSATVIPLGRAWFSCGKKKEKNSPDIKRSETEVIKSVPRNVISQGLKWFVSGQSDVDTKKSDSNNAGEVKTGSSKELDNIQSPLLPPELQKQETDARTDVSINDLMINGVNGQPGEVQQFNNLVSSNDQSLSNAFIQNTAVQGKGTEEENKTSELLENCGQNLDKTTEKNEEDKNIAEEAARLQAQDDSSLFDSFSLPKNFTIEEKKEEDLLAPSNDGTQFINNGNDFIQNPAAQGKGAEEFYPVLSDDQFMNKNKSFDTQPGNEIDLTKKKDITDDQTSLINSASFTTTVREKVQINLDNTDNTKKKKQHRK